MPCSTDLAFGGVFGAAGLAVDVRLCGSSTGRQRAAATAGNNSAAAAPVDGGVVDGGSNSAAKALSCKKALTEPLRWLIGTRGRAFATVVYGLEGHSGSTAGGAAGGLG